MRHDHILYEVSKIVVLRPHYIKNNPLLRPPIFGYPNILFHCTCIWVELLRLTCY